MANSLSISIYDATTIDSLEWPNTPDGEYAKAFLIPIVKNSISHYIDNIEAQLYVFKITNYVFPVVAVTENNTNSWICSPYGHYISYGQEFSHLIHNRIFSRFIKNSVGFFGHIAKSRRGRLNSVVYVNNWLFSTDLYPKNITPDMIKGLKTAMLSTEF